jgi:hypothetical protein
VALAELVEVFTADAEQRIALLACGPITHDTGSFADVERLQTV